MPLGANITKIRSYNNDFFAFNSTNFILKYSNNNWDTLFNYPNETLRNFRVQDDNYITCTNNRITVYNQNLDTTSLFFAYSSLPGITPNDVQFSNGYYWIADE
jgi:hypothetical protein